MKKDSKSDAQKDYETARNKWARENAELFLDTLKMVAEKLDAELTPMQYVRAYKICIEDLKFTFPSEFKIAELISKDDEYEQALAMMQAVMKQFRLTFWKEWHSRNKRKRKKRA